MPTYQFAVCAKDLAQPLSHLQAVVQYQSNKAVVGRTEILTEATSHPVWHQLVIQKDAITPLPDMQLVVHIVQVLPDNQSQHDNNNSHDDNPHLWTPVATATFDGRALSQAYYHAVARYTDTRGDGHAKICLSATPHHAQGALRLQLAGFDLPDLDFGMFWQKNNLSDPFCEIHSSSHHHHHAQSRRRGDAVVHRTEVIWDNLNPVWEPFELDLDVLCDGKLDTKIKMDVYDKDSGTNKQYLGHAFISVNDMLSSVVADEDVPPIEPPPKRNGIRKSATQKSNGKKVTYPPNFHRLAKGGVDAVKGCLYVKVAELLPQKYVSRKIRNNCQTVLSSLDNRYETLAAQFEKAQKAVQDAQAIWEEAAAHESEFDQQAHAAAWQQAEAQAHLQECKDELGRLQASVRAAPVDGQLQLVLCATQLPNLDAGLGVLNKSDPMYEIVVPGNDNADSNDSSVVLRSNVVQNNLNPTWELQTLPLHAVGGLEKTFSIVLWDVNKNDLNNKDAMGAIHDVTVEKLMTAASDKATFALGPPLKKGRVSVERADLENRVDNVAALQSYKAQHFQPAADACTQTTLAFEAVHKQALAAHQKASQANMVLVAAQDKAETLQKALEIVQKGRH